MEADYQEKLCRTYWELMERVRSDPEYLSLQERLAELEPEFEAVVAGLSEPDRLTVELYLACRENLSRRTAEYACEQLLPQD